MKKQLPGFALLELAIALSIMGLLIGLSLPMLGKLMRHNQVQNTKNTQEIVLKALGSYVSAHQSLPCPAKDLDGKAQLTCQDMSLAQGIIPFNTLNIPKSYALDGFGRFFSYIIDPAFAKPNYCQVKNTPMPLSVGGIDLHQDNPIVVILISHGSKGYGAFNGNLSKVLLDQPSGLEIENSNGDFIFQDNQPGFDHIVKWVSKDLFAIEYMGMMCKREDSDGSSGISIQYKGSPQSIFKGKTH